MGSLVFLVLWVLGYKGSPNDYQWLPLLISLDTIAAALVWQARARHPPDR